MTEHFNNHTDPVQQGRPDDPAGGPAWVSETVEPQNGRGGGARSAGLQAGVAAVIVLATFGIGFALVSALGGGNNTGAGSPEDAVRDLAASVEAEDVLGMMATMSPSEVGTMAELYQPMVDLGRQQGLIEGSGSPFDGIDVTADLRATRTERLHDDVAKVYVDDGTMSVSLDPSAMSISDVEGLEPIDETIEVREVVQEMAQAASGEYIYELDRAVVPPSGLFLMTVRENGKWYVSYQYTFAEYIREVLGLPPANFDISRNADFRGADSPEGVLEIIEAAIDDFGPEDIEAALDEAEELAGDFDFDLTADGGSLLVPPDEIAVVLDYAPSFEALFEDAFAQNITQDELDEFDDVFDEMRDALAELDYDFDFEAEFETSRVDDRGDRVVLQIDRASLDADIQVTVEQNSADVDIALELLPGLCGRVSVAGTIDGDFDQFEESACAGDVLPGTDFDGIVVVMVKRDGQWYMSMLETAIEYAQLAIESELEG